jgi:hypothetical protein
MASPLFFPRFRAFTTNGAPLNGGKLYTYIPGTSTPKATYTTAALSVANANPVILDANGEANIFTGDGEAYKVVLYDSLDVLQWSIDNVVFGAGSGLTSDLSAVNWIDNGGAEVYNAPLGRPVAAAGAAATCVFDRWWAYRNGLTGYTVAGASVGFPRFIQMQRTAADANTTSIEIGQSTGYSGSDIRSPYEIIYQLLNPPTGITPKSLVLSAYVLKGANFSGSGVTAEIVTNAFDNNVLDPSGSAWVVDASATLTAAQLSTTSLTQIFVTTTALTANQSVLGVRIRFDSPSGTAGAADWIKVTGVKLEVGYSGTPTNYDIPTMLESVQRCQRFYRKFSGGAAGAEAGPIAVSAYGAASQNYDVPVPLVPTMMQTPTAVKSGTWTVVNCGQPSVTHVNRFGFTLRTAVTALGAFSFTPSSTADVITFDAETPP